MKQRVITAVIALIFFIPIVLAGGLWIDWLTVLLASIGIAEIFMMKKRRLTSVDFLLALLATLTIVVPDRFWGFLPEQLTRYQVYFIFVMLMMVWTVLVKNRISFDDIGVYTLASLYIGTGFHGMAAIRNGQEGLKLLGYVFVVVWATDVGAYMIGRKIGRHKLWPAISPNKTWEGSIGALICALVFASLYVMAIPTTLSKPKLISAVIFLSIAGQIGDLVESAYKRHYGVKDSGKILPGHGGILDRFDSLLFVLPIVGFLVF